VKEPTIFHNHQLLAEKSIAGIESFGIQTHSPKNKSDGLQSFNMDLNTSLA
jgi:hypothetical protein